MYKIILIVVSFISLIGCQNEGFNSLQSVDSEVSELFSKQKFSAKVQPPQNWSMETRQINHREISSVNSTASVGNDRWRHDTLNHAYIGTNAWGFGGNAGGTGSDSNLTDAFVKWEYDLGADSLNLEWFVGGYHRNYNNRPGDGWYYGNQNGGNNVKAYPRMGIGSASGQPFVTSGAPNNMPTAFSGGVQTVDQQQISNQVGLPSRIDAMPEIDIHVDMHFSGGSNTVDKKDQYGNYFFAIDSYFHNVDEDRFLTHSSLKGSLNGINDSSGSIYNRAMDFNSEATYQATTKRWAMMIWYHKPAYYATSGGTPLNGNRTVEIDGGHYFVKYKIENAGGKLFKYIAFIRDRSTTELTTSGQQPVIKFKRFTEFMTGGKLQGLLDAAGNLPDVDNVQKRITAPTSRYILSDINVGVEASANPDTQNDQSPKPVKIHFKNLYFNVAGKGEFGFRSSNQNSQVPQIGAALSGVPDDNDQEITIASNTQIREIQSVSSTPTNSNECIDEDGDGYGWDGKQSCVVSSSQTSASSSAETPKATTAPANNNNSNNVSAECIDEDGDGYGWDGKQSCVVSSSQTSASSSAETPKATTAPANNNNSNNVSAECIDEDGDGYGWDGKQSCVVSSSQTITRNTQSVTTSSPECVDEDGDGYGWDGKQSCVANSSQNNKRNTQSTSTSNSKCIDNDGDGYGWDGKQSCLVNKKQ